MVNESEGYLSCVVNRSFYSALVLHSVMNGYVVSPRKSYTPYILQFYTESLSGEIKQPSHPTALRRYFFTPANRVYEYCACIARGNLRPGLKLEKPQGLMVA